MPKLILAVVLIVCIGAVMGLLGYALTKKQTRVETPEVKMPDEIVEDETANWQTYRNGFYKDYEIKYPSELTLIERGQDKRAASLFSEDYKLNMTNGFVDGFGVNLSVNYYNSLDDLFECNKKDTDIFNCLLANENLLLDYKNGEVKKENLTVNGYPAIKYEFISDNGKNNNIGIVIQKGNKFYIVAIVYREDKNIKLFNQILSSFKFIEKDETANWQTYRNEEFGFEFKYPEYYSKLKYDFDSMAEEDYDRIHFFRYMDEEELNDFKKHYMIAFEEGGTHSGTIFVKLYNNKEELKKWYEIKAFKDFELREFESVDYYIANKLTKHLSNKKEQSIVGYNYIIPHREIDNLFLVFEIPEFLKSKFEKDFLSTFKFIEK